MVPNRRQFSRRPTESLVFVTVDENNGGIPCNLARGGVALGLVQPVAEHQVVTLGFAQPGSSDRIETAAEAVWIDNSGANAGFRFLNMPQRSYQTIENWLAGDASVDESSPASQVAAGNMIPSRVPLARDGDSAAYDPGRTSLWSQSAAEQEAESERFAIPLAFTQAESANSRGAAHGKAPAGAAKSATKLDDLGGWRSVLDTATVTSETVEADTTEPSWRIRLRLAEILANPYLRRKLIVRSLWAVALILLAAVCMLLVRFHSELVAPAAWSGSIRDLLRRNDAMPGSKPKPAPPLAVIKKRPSRHNGRAAKPAQSTAAKNSKNLNTATGFNDEAESSDHFPAITIVSSRYVPQSLSAAIIGHSRILLTPLEAVVDPVDPSPGAFLVSQEISGSLPEGRPLLTYPARARQKKLEGSVTVRAVINQDGSVRNVRLVSGNPLLASAVLDAVEQWHYRPWNDGPAETEAMITVKFTISTK